MGMKKKNFLVIVLFVLFIMGLGYYLSNFFVFSSEHNHSNVDESYFLEDIPAYRGDIVISLNDNRPNFTEEDYSNGTYESYSELDHLNRCGVASSLVGIDLMPTEDRKSIANVHPTGWKQAKYDIISGKYLYNRCHLIGFQLTGENANPNNLITCTKMMNVTGMLPLENKVADYVKRTNHHVLYRVRPVFEGDNLLASGVQIEASSVEDKCGDICFNVFVYNIQDGIFINYLNGESSLAN